MSAKTKIVAPPIEPAAIDNGSAGLMPSMVPGKMLGESLQTMEIVTETLGQLAALFQTIGEKDGDPKTKALANMGWFVAENAAETMGCDRERILQALGIEV